MLSVGIVGLPNVGKSTLFNALVKQELAKVDSHPFTTIKPNVGVVGVPDERLDKLVEMIVGDPSPSTKLGIRMTGKTKKVPATIRFVDIAGLVKGAAKGEGLGNQFLGQIREVDLICFVLRDFEDEKVEKIGKNPQQDLETLKMELILKDLETIGKMQNSKFKIQNAKLKFKIENLLEKLEGAFNRGLMVNQARLDKEEKEVVKQWYLLTDKPYFIVLNVNENNLLKIEEKIKNYQDWTVIPICAKLEEQLVGLSPEEQREYLGSVGLQEGGLARLIKTAYEHLGLITFYTLKGGREISAWSLRVGSTALEASSLVHTDFAKKFIKVEVINWQKLLKAGSWKEAKEKGWLALQGRDYEVKDGEVVEFKIG